jgi:hypothetical protein
MSVAPGRLGEPLPADDRWVAEHGRGGSGPTGVGGALSGVHWTDRFTPRHRLPELAAHAIPAVRPIDARAAFESGGLVGRNSAGRVGRSRWGGLGGDLPGLGARLRCARRGVGRGHRSVRLAVQGDRAAGRRDWALDPLRQAHSVPGGVGGLPGAPPAPLPHRRVDGDHPIEPKDAHALGRPGPGGCARSHRSRRRPAVRRLRLDRPT